MKQSILITLAMFCFAGSIGQTIISATNDNIQQNRHEITNNYRNNNSNNYTANNYSTNSVATRPEKSDNAPAPQTNYYTAAATSRDFNNNNRYNFLEQRQSAGSNPSGNRVYMTTNMATHYHSTTGNNNSSAYFLPGTSTAKPSKKYCDSSEHHCPPPYCKALLYAPCYKTYYSPFDYSEDLDISFRYEKVENTAMYSSTAMYRSLAGYVVYNGDTLSGMVTLAYNSIFMQQPTDQKDEYGYRFSYNDNSIKSVVVLDGGYALFLTRPTSDNDPLLRVLHVGKLNLYDDRYSTPTADNFNKGHLQIVRDGELQHLGGFVTLDSRYPLMQAVNKAYGVKLRTGDMSWEELVRYLNKLN